MGPPWCLKSTVDRNIVVWYMTVMSATGINMKEGESKKKSSTQSPVQANTSDTIYLMSSLRLSCLQVKTGAMKFPFG